MVHSLQSANEVLRNGETRQCCAPGLREEALWENPGVIPPVYVPTRFPVTELSLWKFSPVLMQPQTMAGCSEAETGRKNL